MLMPDERALLTEQQDRPIELYVSQEEAAVAEDWRRVGELQIEIDDAKEHVDAIRVSAC
jgi:hypothetical protein